MLSPRIATRVGTGGSSSVSSTRTGLWKTRNVPFFEENDVAHAHLTLELGLVHGECGRDMGEHVRFLGNGFCTRRFCSERRERGNPFGK